MRILIHGEMIKSSINTEPLPSLNTTSSLTHGSLTDGFIMLRGLLVMFIVIICFAAVLTAMAVLPRQGSRLLENVQQEINARNEIVLKRIHR